MIFGADTCGLQGMNPAYFGNPLTFPLEPS